MDEFMDQKVNEFTNNFDIKILLYMIIRIVNVVLFQCITPSILK